MVLQKSKSSGAQVMKTVLFGWLLGLGFIASHMGCCSIRLVGDRCDFGGCGENDCEGVGSCGNLRSRIANRIRNANCSSGCGEVYWDEQINEPPVCDPCGCNGEFECGSGRSCPTALGRLRNLWGYRYMPSSCGECSSCGTTSSHSSAACSTCADNTQPGYATEVHSTTPTRMSTSPSTHGAMSTKSPTPAAKPKSQPHQTVAPTPTPDSNAMFLKDESQNEFLAVGSGVESRRTPAKPVVANTRQSIQAKPKLVTNPR